MLGKISILKEFLTWQFRKRVPLEIRHNWECLLGSLFFASIFFMRNPDLWRRQVYAGTMLSVVVLSVVVGQRLRSWVPAAALFYFLWNCASTFTVYPQYEDWSIQATAQSFAFIVSVTLIVMLISREQREFLFETLATIAFGTSLWLIGRRFFTPLPYAWMNNPSADSAILAVLYPILAIRENWLNRWALLKHPAYSIALAVLPLIAIGCCHSSTGVAAAVVALGALAFSFRKNRVFLLGAGILAAIPLASIPFFLKSSFFVDHGRYGVWRIMMNFWREKVDPVFGMGGGTFFYAGPKVQRGMGYRDDTLFGFMHNDYLQTVFEHGWIGLVLLLLVGAIALRRSLDRNWLFAALCTYGFIMVTQYPLRFFASALIGALLLREAYETTRAT